MKVRSLSAVAVAGVVAASALVVAPVASAMGSGNPYVDMQTGVTYTVYQPTYTAGLKQRHVGPNLAGDPSVEQNLYAVFGKRGARTLEIYQGNPMSSDIGVSFTVGRTTIQGQPATIHAFCDQTQDKCTKADVAKVGGYVDVTLPAGPNLRPTRVWVDNGRGGLSADQLVKVAKSLKPVQ